MPAINNSKLIDWIIFAFQMFFIQCICIHEAKNMVEYEYINIISYKTSS